VSGTGPMDWLAGGVTPREADFLIKTGERRPGREVVGVCWLGWWQTGAAVPVHRARTGGPPTHGRGGARACGRPFRGDQVADTCANEPDHPECRRRRVRRTGSGRQFLQHRTMCTASGLSSCFPRRLPHHAGGDSRPWAGPKHIVVAGFGVARPNQTSPLLLLPGGESPRAHDEVASCSSASTRRLKDDISKKEKAIKDDASIEQNQKKKYEEHNCISLCLYASMLAFPLHVLSFGTPCTSVVSDSYEKEETK